MTNRWSRITPLSNFEVKKMRCLPNEYDCKLKAFRERRIMLSASLDDKLYDSEFVSVLRTKRSIEAILRLLLWIGCKAGFLLRLRYYRFNADTNLLWSVFAIGHGRAERTCARMGRVEKSRKHSPTESSDTFWCMERKAPVLFLLDELAEMPLTVSSLVEGIAVVHAPNQCRATYGSKCNYWLDIPLYQGSAFVGKLSCDLVAEPMTRLDFQRLSRLAELASHCVAAIEALQASSIRVVDGRLSRISSYASRIANLDSLMKFFAFKLPEIVGCKYASILTLSEDIACTRKLVLRRTSCPALIGSEETDDVGKGIHSLDQSEKSSLSSFVFKQDHSIRLHSLQNRVVLRKQLETFCAPIQFRSDHLRDVSSFMAVPIRVPGGSLLGVLELYGKHGGKCFTAIEEARLVDITEKCLGMLFENIAEREVEERTSNEEFVVGVKHLVELCIGNPLDGRPSTRFADTMEMLFPCSRSDARHLYLLNEVDTENGLLFHRQASGSLLSSSQIESPVCFADTLTAHTFEREDCAYLNDLAIAKQRGLLKRVCSSAVSALAIRANFLGSPNSVLVMQSDRHDLHPETDGQVLRKFVFWGKMLASMKA